MERYEVSLPTLDPGRYLVSKVIMPDGTVRGLSIVDIESADGVVYAISITPFAEELPNTIQIDTPIRLNNPGNH